MKQVLIILLIFCTVAGIAKSKTKRKVLLSISSVQKKLEKDPNNLTLRWSLARAYVRKKLYGKCVEALIPFSNEISTSAQFQLASCLEKSKRFEDEIKAYKKITSKSPESIRGQMGLAKAYYNAKEYPKSVEMYKSVIEKRKKYAPAYIGLLRVFEINKNEYEELETLKEMTVLFGETPLYSGKLCILYSKQAYIDDTIKFCGKAIRSKEPKGEYYIHLAKAYLLLQKNEEAKNWYNLAAKRFPKSDLVQSTVATYYLGLKDYYVAKRYFSSAVKANDSSSQAYLGLAKCNFEIKQYQEAFNSFLKACKLDSKTATSFKQATARLRIKKEKIWFRKFDSKSKTCAYKPLKKLL